MDQSDSEMIDITVVNETENTVFDMAHVKISTETIQISTDSKSIKSNESGIVDEKSSENLLEWRNISVYGPKNKKMFSRKKATRKLILDNVSGSARPYSMTALMGASGAGKSTLLNILSMTINNKLKAYGQIKYNGKDVNIRNIASYVPQTDLFFTRLTVIEHLRFNIEMYYGDKLSNREKKDLLSEIINRTNLIRCKNNQIGDPLRGIGISGGERRRLSLASELIRRPKIVFADEPTSGLDNFMAVTIVNLLNDLSNEGIIVICVIHQPSSQIFSAFGQVHLLAEGRNVFAGSLSLCRDIFIKADLTCPTNFNPADHYIEMIAIIPDSEESCRNKVKLITDTWKKETNQKEEDTETTKTPVLRNVPPKFFTQTYPTTIWKQFVELFGRRLKTVSREPLVSYIRIAQTVLISVIVGLIYLQLDYKVSTNQSILGVLFFLCTNVSFMNLFMVINTFPTELDVFRKEHNNRMYRTVVYFFQITLLEFPISFVTSIISTLITYWMIGLFPTAKAYFYHLLTIYLIVLCASSYGYFISAIAKTPVMASIISAPLMLPLLIFGGFFIQTDQTPVYFIWIEYISWFKYGFELLALIQYKDMELLCDDPLICGSKDPNTDTIRGPLIIENFGFSYNNIETDIIALILIFLLFRLLALAIIVLKTYLNEK